jgi:hypothetical protein
LLVALSRAISRRALLRGIGAAGAASLLAACARNGDTPPGVGEEVPDIREEILRALGADVPPELNFVLPASEFVAGEGRRLVFGLATDEREFLSGLEAEVSVVREDDLAVVHGPVPATSYEDFGPLGVYGARVSYPEPGIYRIAVVTSEAAAVGALQVISPEDSPVPQLGQPFPGVRTPTTDDPTDLAELCTRNPDCSMHDVSVDAALEEGRPVVLTVATPAYCATAICGPVVDVVEEVKTGSGRDDAAWVHLEVFKDAGNTPVDAVMELRLPTEPWMFFVDAEGDLADKLEGPTPEPLIREGLDTI